MADPVAEELEVAVRRVLAPREAGGGQRPEDVGPPRLDQRPDEDAAVGRDPREAARPGALEQAHQHRLRLVVGGVAEGDAVGAQARRVPQERRVARLAGASLERAAGRDRDSFHRDRQATASRESRDKGRVVGRVGPEAVVHVDDREPEPKLARERLERPEQRDGVRAARHRHQDSFAASKHRMAANRVADAGDHPATRPAGPPRPLRPRSAPSSTPAPSASACRSRSDRPRRPPGGGRRRRR